MKIQEFIEQRMDEILEDYKNGKLTDIDIITAIREEGKDSNFLFDIILEKFLYHTYSKGYVIVSKGMLKLYLNSNYKQYEDCINRDNLRVLGGQDNIIINIKGKPIRITKGIFLKIIEQLNLTKTKDAYIKYLLINETSVESLCTCIENIPSEEEIIASGIMTKKEFTLYDDLEKVIDVMFTEFDKLDGSKKYILIENKISVPVLKKNMCSKCGSKGIKIVYGLPTREGMLNKKIILGGCCIDDDSPDFQCNKCGHEWQVYKKTD